MAQAGVIRVETEVLDHDHGHWCNRCLLSTGTRAWVARIFPRLGRTTLGIQLWCTECGSDDVTVADDARHC